MSEHKRLIERNQIIRKEIVNGKTLSEMAGEFGISHERVRQILIQKVNYKKILKERRKKLFQKRLKKVIEKAGLQYEKKFIYLIWMLFTTLYNKQ